MKIKDEPKMMQTRTTTVHRRAMLDIPDQLSEAYGVQASAEAHVQGIAPTESIVSLLQSFGIDAGEHISFPFQKFGRNRMGRTSIRIEAPSGHSLHGVPVVGHQWMFRQETPEQVA